MALNGEEVERYARHLVLHEVGGPGQAKLKAARVLVIGAGGLGSPLLLYLAAAGIGTIGVIDHDTVSLSNLQRQILHTTARVGMAKTASARETLLAINPHVTVMAHDERIAAENALDIIGRYDIVAQYEGDSKYAGATTTISETVSRALSAYLSGPGGHGA